jgi:hypothetical protein
VLLFVVVSVVSALGSWPVLASANNIKAQFPSMYGGTLWMSGRMGYQGIVQVTSSNCNASELTMYNNVKSTTTGKPEMTPWANGIRFSRYRCDNVWDYTADLRISYKAQSYFDQGGGVYIGGRNVDVEAAPDYCHYWNTSHPCGGRPNVEINQVKYANGSATYQESELEHETGHGLGLSHHCTGPAVMNNGSSGCPDGYQGRFGSAPGYFATDRQGINSVYP